MAWALKVNWMPDMGVGSLVKLRAKARARARMRLPKVPICGAHLSRHPKASKEESKPERTRLEMRPVFKTTLHLSVQDVLNLILDVQSHSGDPQLTLMGRDPNMRGRNTNGYIINIETNWFCSAVVFHHHVVVTLQPCDRPLRTLSTLT